MTDDLTPPHRGAQESELHLGPDGRIQIVRPAQPEGEDSVWYRGWEVGFDYLADHWSNNGWRAYKGGVDLDAPNVDAASFTAVLDAVDDKEDDDADAYTSR